MPRRSPTRRQGATVEFVQALLFLAIALLMAAIAIATGILAVRLPASDVAARGVVIEIVERVDNEGNALYYPVVNFPLPDGSRRTIETSDGSWPPAYKVDDTVTVTYDPAHPERAHIASPADALTRWIWPFVTAILSAAFLAAALLARWLARGVRP